MYFAVIFSGYILLYNRKKIYIIGVKIHDTLMRDNV